MAWHENFPTIKNANIHHLATLFNNTNAASDPEESDQIGHGVFCQIFTKSCQITNIILLITLPKFCKFFSLKDLV